MHRSPEFPLFFSNQIGCCNYKGGKKSPGDKVTRFVQAKGNTIEEDGPDRGYVSFDFSPA